MDYFCHLFITFNFMSDISEGINMCEMFNVLLSLLCIMSM